ncbi:calcium permeable stress-gated cation channel 1 [Diutina catenulata]
MTISVVDKPTPTLYLSERVFYLQLVICLVIGSTSFLLFCVLRRRWPHIYAVRTLRKKVDGSRDVVLDATALPRNFFGWMGVVLRFSDEEMLQCSGLDALVFITYFKMAIRIFFSVGVLTAVVLAPLRHFYGGSDMVGDDPGQKVNDGKQTSPLLTQWVYPAFTYVFSVIVWYNLLRYTQRVVQIRQKYLAQQNSITDRTVRIDNIPQRFLTHPGRLQKFIEDLGIGKVVSVKYLYDWSPLERLFDERRKLLSRLENAYASSYDLDIDIYNQSTPSVVPKCLENPDYHDDDGPREAHKGQIAEWSTELSHINAQIRDIQHNRFEPATSMMVGNFPKFRQLRSAFVTMDSVASAQMAAQTVWDPRVYTLSVALAPAPKDIEWKNYRYSWTERTVRANLITIAIVFSYSVISFLASQLAVLLSETKIDKQWPWLGEILAQREWLKLVVTGILPPFLFSMLNLSMLYFYRWLSQHQGYLSNSDVELSTLSKNFFYVFFIWFLVFVASNTITDYLSYMKDTTKIAQELAKSLKGFAGFYVNLILLQGLAQFPVKLLQIGDFVILNVLAQLFLLKDLVLKTPRDFRSYYFTPQVFDFGIHMPQHLFIFIVVLIYSVVSTKIVASGFVYFCLGYVVYKYQLIYNFVHPPHSTGKVWVMIFRRMVLALVIFQLFMVGTLALSNAYWASVACVPLVLASLVVLYNFERYYTPLIDFIALRAVLSPGDYDAKFANDDDESPIDQCSELEEEVEEGTADQQPRPRKRRQSTLDEEREQWSDYTYPNLTDPLNGPWVGFEGDYISMVEYHHSHAHHDLEDADVSVLSTTDTEVIIKKKLRVSEWE